MDLNWYRLSRNQNPLNVLASQITRYIILNFNTIVANPKNTEIVITPSVNLGGEVNHNTWHKDKTHSIANYKIQSINVNLETLGDIETFKVISSYYVFNLNKPDEYYEIKVRILINNGLLNNIKSKYSGLYMRLFQSARHELEHTLQRIEKRNENGIIGGNIDLDSFDKNIFTYDIKNRLQKRFEYLSKPYEVEAFVRGIMERYKKDKNQKDVYKIIEDHITIGFWSDYIDSWINNLNNNSIDKINLINMSNTLRDLYYSEIKRIYPFIKKKYD